MVTGSIAGALHISLSWHAGVVTRVDIRNTRPSVLSRIFVGRPLVSALTLMPQLFSVCAVAQQIAALRAAESYLRLTPSVDVKIARQRLLDAEMIRELGLQLFSHWLSDDQGCKVALVRWFAQVKSLLGWALLLEPQAHKPDKQWQHQLNALWQALPLTAIADASLAALIKPEVEASLLCLSQTELGLPAPWLNIHEPSVCRWLSEELNAEQAEPFCRMPDLQGEPHETGAIHVQALGTRQADGVIRQRLLGRFQQLQALMDSPENMPVMPHGLAAGIGVAEAARGVLLHHLRLENTTDLNAVVQSYNIVAPTEWNFHPSGTLVRMLEGVDVELAALESLVGCLVRLVDPCVEWTLKVDVNHA